MSVSTTFSFQVFIEPTNKPLSVLLKVTMWKIKQIIPQSLFTVIQPIQFLELNKRALHLIWKKSWIRFPMMIVSDDLPGGGTIEQEIYRYENSFYGAGPGFGVALRVGLF